MAPVISRPFHMPVTNIEFFDIPTALGIPTSPYTWRVRLYLNFRALNYKTRWVPTAQIEATCISLGIPPTDTKPSGEPRYTLPAIIDYTRSSSEPTIVSDSLRIIRYLENEYFAPSHVMFPSDFEPRQAEFKSFVDTQINALAGTLTLMDFYRAKPPGDRLHFRTRIEARFGVKFADLELKGSQRESTFDKLKDNFTSLLNLFGDGQEEGYLLSRDAISYPDFALGGSLMCMKTVSPEDAWMRVSTWNGGKWNRYIQAFQRWVSVDEHPKFVGEETIATSTNAE